MDGLKYCSMKELLKNWKELKHMNDEEIPYSHVYLLVCTKCGKLKQVKTKAESSIWNKMCSEVQGVGHTSLGT